MTSDLRIQGEVVVNSEQAEGALNRVGDKATQMAANMQQAGERAGVRAAVGVEVVGS